jgi:hypothetical protein
VPGTRVLEAAGNKLLFTSIAACDETALVSSLGRHENRNKSTITILLSLYLFSLLLSSPQSLSSSVHHFLSLSSEENS